MTKQDQFTLIPDWSWERVTAGLWAGLKLRHQSGPQEVKAAAITQRRVGDTNRSHDGKVKEALLNFQVEDWNEKLH